MAQAKTSSQKRKENRAASYARGEERKKLRAADNEAARKRNIELRKAGKPTPSDIAKEKRAKKRASIREAFEQWNSNMKRQVASIEADDKLSLRQKEEAIAKLRSESAWLASREFRAVSK